MTLKISFAAAPGEMAQTAFAELTNRYGQVPMDQADVVGWTVEVLNVLCNVPNQDALLHCFTTSAFGQTPLDDLQMPVQEWHRDLVARYKTRVATIRRILFEIV